MYIGSKSQKVRPVSCQVVVQVGREVANDHALLGFVCVEVNPQAT